MSNFFTDNPDLMFTLRNLEMEEIVALRENDYKQAEQFDFAPENYEDAMDNYKRVMEVIGEITGERIAPRSRQVDEEGPYFKDGVVKYHPLTDKNLKDLKDAGVMGVMLPRQYGLSLIHI